jgi:hypothetical protein
LCAASDKDGETGNRRDMAQQVRGAVNTKRDLGITGTTYGVYGACRTSVSPVRGARASWMAATSNCASTTRRAGLGQCGLAANDGKPGEARHAGAAWQQREMFTADWEVMEVVRQRARRFAGPSSQAIACTAVHTHAKHGGCCEGASPRGAAMGCGCDDGWLGRWTADEDGQ